MNNTTKFASAGCDAESAEKDFISVPTNFDTYDENVIRKAVSKIARHYGPNTSCCVAVDCGDRIELRAKSSNLPRFIDAPREGNLLVKCSVIRNFPVVIGDASKDDRYCNDPLVQGDTAIRFFVGVPLVTKTRFCIGLLCMMNPDPVEAYVGYAECKELILASEHIVEEYEKLSCQSERAAFTVYTLDAIDLEE